MSEASCEWLCPVLVRPRGILGEPKTALVQMWHRLVQKERLVHEKVAGRLYACAFMPVCMHIYIYIYIYKHKYWVYSRLYDLYLTRRLD